VVIGMITAALQEDCMIRTSLICLSVLMCAACAAWNGAPTVQTAASVPVYSCDSTRIKPARRCREWYGGSHPSISVSGPGSVPTIPGPR